MRAQSWISALLLAAVVACTSDKVMARSSSDLLATLRREGASKFADRLESDPETLDMFLANASTVFAPSDLFLRKQARLASQQEQSDAKLQGCRAEQKLKSENRLSSTLKTFAGNSKLDGQQQVVVLDTRPENMTGPAKRWDSRSVFRRGPSNETIPPPLPNMKLSSGLGKTASIIKADIKFDKGLIHITDGYFTRPQSLSNTIQATGQTTFANLAASGNLTQKLDDMHSVTVFVPSNKALSSSDLSGSAAAQLVSNHVVSGFVGYLPDLKDGTTLKTQSGQTLTIKVTEGRYYVNGAPITLADMILENGVAHVIDKPLNPAPVTAGITRTGVTDFTLSVLGAFSGIAAFALI